MRIVAILQARMGSSRLPGKVLSPILGRPMLAHQVARIQGSALLNEILIATSTHPRDDPIVELAEALNVPCFRGSEEDCLDRYYQAARQASADVVVRLTGDCPILEGAFVDWVIERFLEVKPPCDHLNTFKTKTFPLGLAVEVMTFKALETAWREDSNPEWREHVTPFIHRQPDRFRVASLVAEKPRGHMRLTVDTPADLELVRRVYEHFGHARFTIDDVFTLVDANPEWLQINAHVKQRELK